MTFHRNTIWLVPLLFIGSFPLWSPPLGDFLTPRGGFDPDLNKPPTDTHNFTMETVKILQNQDGKKTALIRAEQAHTDNNDNDILIMEHVDADIFDDNDNITRILAKTGKYNIVTKTLTLRGDVVIDKTQDKQVLYTDLLHYNSEERTINCPGKTLLKSEDAEIDGGSLDYDIKTGQYVIGNRVKTTIKGFAPEP
jgi:LPS export ABC transporter protein LptC